MGAYLNRQGTVTLNPRSVVTQTHTYSPMTPCHTHTSSLTEDSDIHSCTGAHPSPPPVLLKYTITIHSAKSTHTTSARLHFIHNHSVPRARTLTHTPTLSHTRTHFSEGPSSYCPSIWLVPFVPHVLSVAAEKLLWAGGAVRPHDGGACPDLWKTFVVT